MGQEFKRNMKSKTPNNSHRGSRWAVLEISLATKQRPWLSENLGKGGRRGCYFPKRRRRAIAAKPTPIKASEDGSGTAPTVIGPYPTVLGVEFAV